jgi:tetratricopeptide (TPR) repeat protein
MKKNVQYCLVFLLLLAANPLLSQTEICAEGRQWMAKENYQKAIISFEKCISSKTHEKADVTLLGQCYFKLGNFANAKKLFLEILETDSLHAGAIKSLASIFETEEHAPKAIKYYSLLIDLYPENSIYKRKKAQLLYTAGERGEAFNLYAEAYHINSNDIHTVKGLVELLHTNDQFEEIDRILSAFRILDNKNVNALLLSGRNKYKRKQFDSAVHFLSLATNEIDLNNYYHKMLGYSLMQIDSIDLSIYYLEKSLVNEGSPEYAHYYLASAYEKKGEMETSKFHYKKAIDAAISNDVHRYYRELGRIYDQENNLKDAIVNFQEAYKHSLDPTVLFYLARASDIYYKDKNIAIRYYAKYIRMAPDDQAEYKSYARDRSLFLKEQIHLSN